MLLELGVLELLNPLLSIPDPEVLSRVLACMAYASNDLAQLRISYRFAIGADVFERMIIEWPQLKPICVQLTEYFLGVPVIDEYSIGLFRFVMVHFEPGFPSTWVFPVLIRWVKRFRGFPYELLIETRFLTKKLRYYINPTGQIREQADGTREIGGCAMLQCFSMRMLRACVHEFAEFREHCHEMILPEDVIAVVGDAGSDDMVVATGLKLIAEFCACEQMQRFVEQLDVATVMDRILRTGAYRSRINGWRFARVWIERASPKARMFFLQPGLLAQAAEQIDRDTPKLSFMVINFLIAVFEVAIRMRAFGITRSLGTKELVESLSEVEGGHPRTQLSDRAFALVRMVEEAQTAERYILFSPQAPDNETDDTN
jgi:hypothetical protein